MHVPSVHRSIAHPLLDALVGTWSTSVTGSMQGTGTATFAVAVGGTCLLQDEQGERRLADADAPLKTSGHGIYRLSDDGRTLTAWWIDNYAPTLVVAQGTLTPLGFDLSGTAGDVPLRIVLTKEGAKLIFRMFMGDATTPLYTQTYERRAA